MRKHFIHILMIIICIIFITFLINNAFADTDVDVLHQEMRKYLYYQIMDMQTEVQCEYPNQLICTAYDIGDEMVAVDNGITINGDYAEAMIDNYASSCIGTPKESVMEYQINYRLTPAQNKAYQNKTAKIAKRIKAKKLSKEKTVRQCFYYVTRNVTYDYSKKYISYTGYAAAIKHRAVCYGFAQMFYTLCRDNGIPCRIIIGKFDGGDHSWNIVKLGKKWYLCDPTYAEDLTYDGNLPFYLFGTNDCNYTAYAKYRTKEFKKRFPISKVSYKY